MVVAESHQTRPGVWAIPDTITRTQEDSREGGMKLEQVLSSAWPQGRTWASHSPCEILHMSNNLSGFCSYRAGWWPCILCRAVRVKGVNANWAGRCLGCLAR